MVDSKMQESDFNVYGCGSTGSSKSVEIEKKVSYWRQNPMAVVHFIRPGQGSGQGLAPGLVLIFDAPPVGRCCCRWGLQLLLLLVLVRAAAARVVPWPPPTLPWSVLCHDLLQYTVMSVQRWHSCCHPYWQQWILLWRTHDLHQMIVSGQKIALA